MHFSSSVLHLDLVFLALEVCLVQNFKNVNSVKCALKIVSPLSPFKGKTKHCIKVLAPFKKIVQGTALVCNCGQRWLLVRAESPMFGQPLVTCSLHLEPKLTWPFSTLGLLSMHKTSAHADMYFCEI